MVPPESVERDRFEWIYNYICFDTRVFSSTSQAQKVETANQEIEHDRIGYFHPTKSKVNERIPTDRTVASTLPDPSVYVITTFSFTYMWLTRSGHVVGKFPVHLLQMSFTPPLVNVQLHFKKCPVQKRLPVNAFTFTSPECPEMSKTRNSHKEGLFDTRSTAIRQVSIARVLFQVFKGKLVLNIFWFASTFYLSARYLPASLLGHDIHFHRVETAPRLK